VTLQPATFALAERARGPAPFGTRLWSARPLRGCFRRAPGRAPPDGVGLSRDQSWRTAHSGHRG
jgi:hypothetical protein